MTVKRRLVVAFAVTAVAMTAWFFLRKPAPLREVELTGMAERFMAILPGDLPEAQKAEIEGLFRRFLAKADAGEVLAEDYHEVMQLLAVHLDKGSIERKELSVLMARVGYYSYRAQTPDSAYIHPLLEPVDTMR